MIAHVGKGIVNHTIDLIAIHVGPFTSAQADEKSFLVVNTDNNEDTDLGNNRRIQLTSTQLAAVDGGAAGYYTVSFANPITSMTATSPVFTTPEINDTSADHQYVFAVSELAADRTVTLPLLTGNDTFVFEDHTQTLTNKTLAVSTNYNCKDNKLTIGLSSDTTANFQFDCSNITTATTRSLTVQDADGTIGYDHTLDHNFIGLNCDGGTQTLSDATWTNLNYGESDDPGSNYAAPTYTAPVDGVYRFTATIGFANDSTGIRGLRINRAGSVTTKYMLDRVPPASTGLATIGGSVVIADVAASDTFTFQGIQSSGGNLDAIGFQTDTYYGMMSVEYLGTKTIG